MTIGRSELVRLTFGKSTANTAMRWLPFFLPTLALAFEASTATLAAILGLAEAAGLCTFFVGRWLDAGRERMVILVALLAVFASSGFALVGSTWTFAIAAVLLGMAAGLATVGGHAWISARVPFERRARFIGVYEVSWASALLVGAPLVALLISVFGWRGPFVAMAVLAVAAAAAVASIDDGDRPAREFGRPARVPITSDAWIIIAASSSVGLAGLTTIVVAGTWLDEVLGVSTGGVGLVAMAFGVAELFASSSSSAFADRLGKRRTMQFSATLLLLGLGVILGAGTSLLLGVLGLFTFFVGFEYSIVTSFSLVSEAMPAARGQAIGVGNAASTLARGIGIASAGVLYDRFGVEGPVVFSAIGASVSLALLTVVALRNPNLA